MGAFVDRTYQNLHLSVVDSVPMQPAAWINEAIHQISLNNPQGLAENNY